MSSYTRWLPWALCVLAGIVLAPNLLYGMRLGHDVNFHLTLFMSYRDALEMGSLYPRWLPDQMQGLGSPALLIYPPLTCAFFVLIDFLTLHALLPARLLGLGAVLLSLASAYTFYLWARSYVGVRLAWMTGLFYAIAPYHVNLDLYTRGAMAEYTTFVWIPLIFLGVRMTLLAGNAKAAVVLAISIAALFLTHLLTVMLVAPLALAYALICLYTELPASLRLRRFGLLTITAMVGVGLAAFYFVPAVTLLPAANAGGLDHNVAATNIFSAISARSDRFKVKLLLLACCYLVLFLVFLVYTVKNNVHHRRGQSRLDRSSAPALLWIVAGVSCFALMSGLFPFVFERPSPYAQIQFGWRLLLVMEFSLVSLFVYCVASTGHSESRARQLKLGAVVMLLLGGVQCADIIERFHKTAIFDNPFKTYDQVIRRLSPIEYFPIGTKSPQRVEAAIEPYLQYALAEQPAFIASDGGRIIDAKRHGTQFTVRSIASEPTTIMIQQFYFPGWAAFDERGEEIPVFGDAISRLASYVVPAGAHTVTVQRVPTRMEYWGNVVSLAALALLALEVFLLIPRRRGAVLPPQVELVAKSPPP